MYIFIVPALSCPATCSYCNGPQLKTPVMAPDLAVEAIQWAYRLKNLANGYQDQMNVTFHGGEPLLAGQSFYEQVLKKWRSKSIGRVNFGVQSNLWPLTQGLCDLFRRHNVAVGTSLDGPQYVTDRERCSGYYEKTMRSLKLAKRRSVRINAIATITKGAAENIHEVFTHFTKIGMDFSANAAVPRLNHQPGDEKWILPPGEYRDTLITLVHLYLKNTDQTRIDNIDRACRALSNGCAHTCIFTDCLGKYIAVDPNGFLFPCMRFVGHEEYCLGNVKDNPGPAELKATYVWKVIQERNEKVKEECGNCAFWHICMGGCPYNYLTSESKASKKDPYCIAYKDLYRELLNLSVKEIFSKKNRRVISQGFGIRSQGILQDGEVLDLMTGRSHADNRTMSYRRVIAAALLGTGRSTETLAKSLTSLGISRSEDTAVTSLYELMRRLSAPDHKANDVYLHITNGCSGKCTHCYAESRNKNDALWMSPSEIVRISLEASQLGYLRIVLTGGEPLEHPEITEVLKRLVTINDALADCMLVFRTSLLNPVEQGLAWLLDEVAQQIVVSLDGSPEYHDARRFPGAHQATVRNLKKLLRTVKKSTVRLAALVDATDLGKKEADWVFEFADSLGVHSVVVRHPRPIGRALKWVDWEHHGFTALHPEDAITRSLFPRSSCGRGTNLHIEPDGRVYPCYARLDEVDCLGHYRNDPLPKILKAPHFRHILRASVDSVKGCKTCKWRYLCGGNCLAWEHASGEVGHSQSDICKDRRKYARQLLDHSLKQLNIKDENLLKEFNLHS